MKYTTLVYHQLNANLAVEAFSVVGMWIAQDFAMGVVSGRYKNDLYSPVRMWESIGKQSYKSNVQFYTRKYKSYKTLTRYNPSCDFIKLHFDPVEQSVTVNFKVGSTVAVKTWKVRGLV